jgi:hypothetical protein
MRLPRRRQVIYLGGIFFILSMAALLRWPKSSGRLSSLSYFGEPTNIDNILRVECCWMPLNGRSLPSEYIVNFFLFLPFFS